MTDANRRPPLQRAPILVLAAVLVVQDLAPLGAQDLPLDRPDLPRGVAEGVVAFHNDAATLRLTGRTLIPAGTGLSGNVSVLGGPVTLLGRVEGSLQVINGELRLEPGARVTGNVTVVGGRVLGLEAGMVGGTVQVHEPPLGYTFRGDGIEWVERTRRDGVSSPLGLGRSRFTVRTGRNYNRVEGLPVVFGPILETDSRNPLRLDVLGTWRSQSGLQASDLGYAVRLEQSMGGRDELAAVVGTHSEVIPLESWGLSDLEASLATFLLHKDFRDYMEEAGWHASLQWRPRARPFSVGVEYRDVAHRFVAPGGPWSLKDNDQPWRPQPAIAGGQLRSVGLALLLDTRNDVRFPSDGWLVQGSVRQGVGGRLVLPALRVEVERGAGPLRPAADAPDRFFHGMADVRRYNRIGPTSTLTLRGLVAGTPGRGTLPPQYQHTAGGAGSVPGHPLFAVDCGARRYPSVRVPGNDGNGTPADPVWVFPHYGCDRLLVFQAEYRSVLGAGLPRDTRLGNALGLLELTPAWYLFADAARGWAGTREELQEGVRLRENTPWRSSFGAGFSLGDLGAQVSFPLQGERSRPTFTIRLNQRF